MRKTLPMICAMLMSSASIADTINEIESNNTLASAQSIVVSSGQAVIKASISEGTEKDLDYYQFYAKAGDVIDIDVNNGMGGKTPVDTIAAVFGPDPGYGVLRQNDDASSSDMDPAIKSFVAPATGNYVLVIAAYPAAFSYGGIVLTDPAMFARYPVKTGTVAGDYEVVISGLTPTLEKQSAIDISIAIKPGSGEMAPINTKSKGKIPVAILSSPLFKAQTVDTKTLTFGAEGTENSLVKCDWTDEDVNGDWLMDKVCHFDTQKAHFSKGDMEGVVRGMTLDGKEFIGRGYVKVKG